MRLSRCFGCLLAILCQIGDAQGWTGQEASSESSLTARGLPVPLKPWVESHQTGIRMCAMQGSLRFLKMNMREQVLDAEPRDNRLLFRVWSRTKSNATHTQVCSQAIEHTSEGRPIGHFQA